MAGNRRDALTETLRRQLLTELRNGARRAGDRLPSARAVGRQLGADPRVVLAAYRTLAGESLVELRERSGIFVAGTAASDDGSIAVGGAAPAESWLADVLTQAVSRALPAAELAPWLARAATASPRLRAAVVATTEDQAQGIARELAEYYGVEALTLPPGVPAADAWSPRGNGASTKRVPSALRTADFIVTTDACAAPLRRLGARLGKPLVSVDVRADLVGEEWRVLLRQPVYVVVTDARFVTTIRRFFAGTPGADNLHAVVLGRDSVSDIPAGATVYVTHAARARLGGTPVPGRVVPAARVFSPDCAREIMGIVVRENLKRGRERGSGKR